MVTLKRLRSLFSKLSIPLIAILSFATACNQATKATSALTEEDKVALRAFAEKDSAIIISKKWDELTAEYSTDAVRMPPNMPVVEGRDAIRKFLHTYPPVKNFNFQLVDLQGEGNLAYMRGAFNITFMISDSNSVSDTGKILIVFKKQTDGSWMRVVDSWNSDLSPAK